ncbi:MAG: hypothetical protein J3K34DRAFT_520572 [Monoraphidium minutum]|nr:MAG: hypothetical protein J3K34DRAFT_520572 [Monoraphidium minutum]
METLQLSTEEHRIVEELRAKYSSGGAAAARDAVAGRGAGGAGAADQDADGATRAARSAAAAAGGADTAVEVTLCPVCHGSGRVTESYNHRILERACDHCGGQGVLLPAGAARGAAPGEAAGGARQAAIRGSGGSSGGGGGSDSAPCAARGAADGARSEVELRRDVARIDERLAAYHKARPAWPRAHERAGAQRLLEDGAGAAEGAALARQMADALDAQVERLERSRAARLNALTGMGLPA